MTVTIHRQRAAFELCTTATWRDPWWMYADLRDHDPVHHVVPEGAPGKDYWVLSRYADVSAAACDYATFSSRQGVTVDHLEERSSGLTENPPMVMQDPPDHTAFRRMAAQGFTPRQLAAIELKVRAFAAERIERLRAVARGDVVPTLFEPLPTMVVAHYLGVPEGDWDRFVGWTDAINAAKVQGIRSDSDAASAELYTYLTELIQRRRAEPGDDAVSALIASGLGADGDVTGILKILGFVFAVITGGTDTTTGALGGAVELLTEYPEQRAVLVADPGRIPGAVEELLRLTSPVQGLARTTTSDVRIGDVTIPAGRKALLLYASATRDPRQFGPDSDELDVLRNPQAILTFGNGNHLCLGAAVARMQIRVVLEELLARCPNFYVDCDDIEFADGGYVRRATSVPFFAAD